MSDRYCSYCKKEIKGPYYKCLDNFLQIKYFENDSDELNCFCSKECFCDSLFLTEVEVEMSESDEDTLKEDLIESVMETIKGEYDNENDFEEEDFMEEFGPFYSLQDAVDLYLKHKSNTDIIRVCKEWCEEFPGSKEDLLTMFNLEEDDIY